MKPVREVTQDVATLVDLTALDHAPGTEDLADRRRQKVAVASADSQLGPDNRETALVFVTGVEIGVFKGR